MFKLVVHGEKLQFLLMFATLPEALEWSLQVLEQLPTRIDDTFQLTLTKETEV